MTFQQIKTTLTAAGLPGFAVQETEGAGFVAFVDFRDLPAESDGRLDAAFKALDFDVADKGYVFAGVC
ncbi:MAG: hypothetical protein WKF79_00500 [Nocardioides sp.]